MIHQKSMDSGNGGNVRKAWIQETVATLQKHGFRKRWQRYKSMDPGNGGNVTKAKIQKMVATPRKRGVKKRRRCCWTAKTHATRQI